MTAHKTGVLARLTTKLSGIAVGIEKNLLEKLSMFSEKVGVAF